MKRLVLSVCAFLALISWSETAVAQCKNAAEKSERQVLELYLQALEDISILDQGGADGGPAGCQTTCHGVVSSGCECSGNGSCDCFGSGTTRYCTCTSGSTTITCRRNPNGLGCICR